MNQSTTVHSCICHCLNNLYSYNHLFSLFSGTIFDFSQLTEFAALGSYCEYDLFGIETSLYQLCPDVDMPHDGDRVRRIQHLVKEGFQDRILVSHDIHTKHRLVIN